MLNDGELIGCRGWTNVRGQGQVVYQVFLAFLSPRWLAREERSCLPIVVAGQQVAGNCLLGPAVTGGMLPHPQPTLLCQSVGQLCWLLGAWPNLH